MEITQAVVDVVLDSAEVVTAVKPLLEAKLASLGKIASVSLKDVSITVTLRAEG